MFLYLGGFQNFWQKCELLIILTSFTWDDRCWDIKLYGSTYLCLLKNFFLSYRAQFGPWAPYPFKVLYTSVFSQHILLVIRACLCVSHFKICTIKIIYTYLPGGTRSAVARHGAAQHVVRSITSRFVLTRILKY
jgi:hypothetical protein